MRVSNRIIPPPDHLSTYHNTTNNGTATNIFEFDTDNDNDNADDNDNNANNDSSDNNRPLRLPRLAVSSPLLKATQSWFPSGGNRFRLDVLHLETR